MSGRATRQARVASRHVASCKSARCAGPSTILVYLLAAQRSVPTLTNIWNIWGALVKAGALRNITHSQALSLEPEFGMPFNVLPVESTRAERALLYISSQNFNGTNSNRASL